MANLRCGEPALFFLRSRGAAIRARLPHSTSPLSADCTFKSLLLRPHRLRLQKVGMKLISVNVGLPRDIIWRGKAVRSSIWKDPVEGRVRVSTLNLDGDQQSDLSVHGGVEKAVYVYPREHYSYWHTQLPAVDLPGGGFRAEIHHRGPL